MTDRNNIRKLLSFINPGSTRNGLESFTISIEIIGNTAIFCREETETYQVIRQYEFRGYGHEYEKANTTEKINGSTGHHRIISYRFGGLNLMIRYETDGYTDTSSDRKAQKGDSLSDMLGSLSLSSANHIPNASPTGAKLTVKEDGQAVPLESTLEIKTRVVHKPIEFREVAPQLWVSQTPKLVRAYHIKGTFPAPSVEDVEAQTKKWERESQADLKNLSALIRKILTAVKGCGGNALLKYDDKSDKIVISKVGIKRMLPEDLYLKWGVEKTSESKEAEDFEKPTSKAKTAQKDRSAETKDKDEKAVLCEKF